MSGIALRLALLALPVSTALPAGEPERLPISDAALYRTWTGRWIACPGAPERDPGVYRFRKIVELATAPKPFVVHVSADQRFILFVNGRRVGIGPSRGDLYHWRFETFDLAPFLKPGRNLLVATVWNFGAQAPSAQISDRTGFVVQGERRQPSGSPTPTRSWQCAPEPGHQPWPEGMAALRQVGSTSSWARGAPRRRALRLDVGATSPADGDAAGPVAAGRAVSAAGQPAHDP